MTFVSESELKATINLLDVVTGVWDVVVVNPDGGAGRLREAFSIGAAVSGPAVTRIRPKKGAQGTTVHVAVTGTGFDPAAAILSVGKGINVKNQVVAANQQQITADLEIDRAATVRLRAVKVTNADGQSFVLPDAFEVLARPPKVVSVNPTSGEVGEKVEVTIAGVGFGNGVRANLGAGIGVQVDSVAGDGTSMKATLSIDSTAATGVRNVTVTNVDGQSDTAPGAFTVTAPPTPVITNVTPKKVTVGKTLTLTIAGSGFDRRPKVHLGDGITIHSRAVASDGKTITATVTIETSAATGARTLTVINRDGQFATKAAALTAS